MSDRETIRARLSAELSTGTWDLLASHLARGALVEVTSGGGAALLDAAADIALDETDRVKAGLESGDLLPAGSLQPGRYPETSSIEFVIVQPFVVFRRVPAD